MISLFKYIGFTRLQKQVLAVAILVTVLVFIFL